MEQYDWPLLTPVGVALFSTEAQSHDKLLSEKLEVIKKEMIHREVHVVGLRMINFYIVLPSLECNALRLYVRS